MATQLKISTGALSADRTYTDDAGAQRVLLLFARRIGISDELPAQQKLQAVVDWCVGKIQEGAAAQAFDDQRSAIQAQIQEENKLR